MLLLATGCSPYKQVSLERNTFYNNTKVPKRIDNYNVYVHDEQKLYTLSDRSFEHDTLRGVLEEIPAGSVNAHPETNRELRESRKDMHVYLAKSVDELEGGRTIARGQEVKIDRKAVDRVDMFAKNEKNVFARIGLVLAVAAIGVLVIFALLMAAIKGSEEATNNSGSDSNSDSGDSNSGDSGGSDSDSGCYIATMVYGSYDAPNVLVLRAFRDKFLQRFAAGRNFIRWYYANSPGFVAKHRDKRLLGMIIRTALDFFVWIIRPVLGK
jgi:hypothetical protein